MTTTEYKKPLPRSTGDTQAFWEHCKNHELRFQRCSKCSTFRHYPRPLCAECGSFDYEWVPVAPKGTIHAWVTAHRAFHPGFADDVPMPIVIVDVTEAPGVRVMGNFNDGTGPDDLSVGMAVNIVFEDVTPEVTLPKLQKG